MDREKQSHRPGNNVRLHPLVFASSASADQFNQDAFPHWHKRPRTKRMHGMDVLVVRGPCNWEKRGEELGEYAVVGSFTHHPLIRSLPQITRLCLLNGNMTITLTPSYRLHIQPSELLSSRPAGNPVFLPSRTSNDQPTVRPLPVVSPHPVGQLKRTLCIDWKRLRCAASQEIGLEHERQLILSFNPHRLIKCSGELICADGGTAHTRSKGEE